MLVGVGGLIQLFLKAGDVGGSGEVFFLNLFGSSGFAFRGLVAGRGSVLEDDVGAAAVRTEILFCFAMYA